MNMNCIFLYAQLHSYLISPKNFSTKFFTSWCLNTMIAYPLNPLLAFFISLVSFRVSSMLFFFFIFKIFGFEIHCVHRNLYMYIGCGLHLALLAQPVGFLDFSGQVHEFIQTVEHHNILRNNLFICQLTNLLVLLAELLLQLLQTIHVLYDLLYLSNEEVCQLLSVVDLQVNRDVANEDRVIGLGGVSVVDLALQLSQTIPQKYQTSHNADQADCVQNALYLQLVRIVDLIGLL